MLFSMLANLAEDRQGIAREPAADIADVLETLKGQGIDRDAAMEMLGGHWSSPC